MKRAAIYVRVSTEEQRKHGLSVDSQIQALVDYCKENNFNIIDIYNDAGKSASKKYTTRPALIRLMNDCTNGKVDIILFTKLDRWFRSVKDYHKVQEVLDRANVPWRAIWEDYEIETSAGRFKVNIMLAVAEAEAARTSERIKAVNQYKKTQGHYVGSAPTGYKVVGKDLIKDKETKEAVQTLLDTYIQTLSTSKALKAAKEKGLRIERQSFLLMLHRTAYYGDASGYKCEPYITKEDWNIIQENLKRHTRSTKSKRVYLFTGLVRCGYCGHIMVSKTVIRKYKEQHEYKKYVCDGSIGTERTCPHLQITETALESYLLAEIEKTIEAHNSCIKDISKKDDISTTLSKKTSLEAKLSRIATLFEDGDITIEDYRMKRDKIKKELSELDLEPPKKVEQLPAEWFEIYQLLDDEHKQTFWRKTIKSIEVTNETKWSPKITLM